MKKIKLKKILYACLSSFVILCLSLSMVFASGRKIIAKSISDSFTIWSAYHYNYSFNSSAVLTYNNSNNITAISDLAFSNVTYTTGTPSLAANFIPNQKSKTYSGNTARYVVTLTRSVYGYYSDKIDYTLTYKVSDAGSPYSINESEKSGVLVEIEAGDPYDIQLLKQP